MKLRNKTRYDTRLLRKYILMVMKKIGVQPKRYIVDVKYRRLNSRILGRGRYYGKWICLYMTRDTQNLGQLLGTIEHELYHNLGTDHRDMSNGHLVVDWDEYNKKLIFEHPEKLKPKIDKVKLREERARANLRKAETRLKRAKTIYAKWLNKVKYYDNKVVQND